MRKSLIRFRLVVLHALAMSVVLASCVNLTPPWGEQADANAWPPSTGPMGTGGTFDPGEDQPDSAGMPQTDTDMDAVSSGEPGSANQGQDGAVVVADAPADKGDTGGATGGGGSTGADIILDKASSRDDASDAPLAADTRDAFVGSGGASGTGGISGSGGLPGSGGSTGSGGATGSGGTPDAGVPPTNLAFNKPVMASSQDNMADQDAVQGNDGLLTTLFCPADGTFPVWWLVDLGAVYPLVRTDINFELANAFYRYRIETSSDSLNWTTAVDQTANTTRKGNTISDALNRQARYVRITITGVSTGDPGCFLEFLVWGYNTPIGGGATLTNLSVKKPVTFKAEAATKPATRGNDGLYATSFCAGYASLPIWWRVDLGAVHSLARTDVSFEQQTSYYKYKIEVSQNDTTWTTVVDQSNNTTRVGAVLSDTFTASARYVRITINAISTPEQGCFWEFTVWGT